MVRLNNIRTAAKNTRTQSHRSQSQLKSFHTSKHAELLKKEDVAKAINTINAINAIDTLCTKWFSFHKLV